MRILYIKETLNGSCLSNYFKTFNPLISLVDLLLVALVLLKIKDNVFFTYEIMEDLYIFGTQPFLYERR